MFIRKMVSIYESIGKCIYCGKSESETELKKEHIVPYSLGGRAFLPKASCQNCEAITSAFEGRCVSTMYKLLRLRLDIQSRRRKNRIKSMKIPVILNGKNAIIDMPINGLLGMMGFIHFQLPGILRSPEEYPNSFAGSELSVKNIGPRDRSIWEELGISNAGGQIVFHVESYALMMAKVAHCIAIGTFGFENFDHVLSEFILKQETKKLHYYVGGVKEIEPPKQISHHHEIKYEVIPKKENQYYILIKIRLFAYLGGPTTQVIAGFTDEERLQKIKIKLKQGKLPNANPHPLP